METWRTLHPRRILHPPGAISVYGSFSEVSLEPGPSGQELRILPIGQLRPLDIAGISPQFPTHRVIGVMCNNLRRGCFEQQHFEQY